MLRSIVTKSKRWFQTTVRGRSQIDVWSQMELQRRIRKLERQKQEYKQKMDEAKREYDSKIEEAKNADQTRIPELKSEASLLLQNYERLRSQWVAILNGLRFMQQAALGKKIDSDVPEALPTEMSPAQVQSAAENIEERLENREAQQDMLDAANERMEDTWQHSSTHMNSMADDRVDAAIDAARDGGSVPTLDELADETFAKGEVSEVHVTEAVDEPETF